MQEVIELIPNLILLASLLGMIVFSGTYARSADWRANPAGRALMYLMLSMIAILGMAFIHLLVGGAYPGAVFVRTIVYGSFMVSVWRLVRVLYRVQRLSFLSWLGLRSKHPKERKVEPDVQ